MTRPERGRPPDYCSPECRQLFNREKERLRAELVRIKQQCALYELDAVHADDRRDLEEAIALLVHEVEQIRAFARRAGNRGTTSDLLEIAQRLGDARDRVYDRLQN